MKEPRDDLSHATHTLCLASSNMICGVILFFQGERSKDVLHCCIKGFAEVEAMAAAVQAKTAEQMGLSLKEQLDLITQGKETAKAAFDEVLQTEREQVIQHFLLAAASIGRDFSGLFLRPSEDTLKDAANNLQVFHLLGKPVFCLCAKQIDIPLADTLERIEKEETKALGSMIKRGESQYGHA